MEEELCWNCGGAGCRLCGWTGVEQTEKERDWCEAAKEAAEMELTL